MKQPFAETVAQTLIEQLEKGTAPLVRPWQPGEQVMPYNPISGNRYRGINAIMLMMAGIHHDDARWLSYRQIQSLGGQVRPGEKGTLIQYWMWREERTLRDDQGQPVRGEDGEILKVTTELDRPKVFSSVVFNAEQADGLPEPPQRFAPPEWERHEMAEQILSGLNIGIRHVAGDRAYYNPRTDTITLPERGQFPSVDRFYAVILHEASHGTAHPSRLDRDISHPFGSPGYAREELRAEISSMILGEELGIGYDPSQHASYVGHWVKLLQDQPLELFRAAAEAEKIVKFMRQLVPQLSETVVQEAGVTASASDERTNSEVSQERAEERIYIDVPYAEKNEAKTLGARWDRAEKSWYIPEGAALAAFDRWQRRTAHSPQHGISVDPRDEFGAALRTAGLIVDGLPVMDGTMQRVPVEGARRGRKDGAYVGFLDGHPAGFIQNHYLGLQHNWKSSRQAPVITDADRIRLQEEAEIRKAERQQRARAIHEETVRDLKAVLEVFPRATGCHHPYLERKGVAATGNGVSVNDLGPINIYAGQDTPQVWSGVGHLIIPIHTLGGELVGAQSIDPEGRKSFPRGCQLKGGMHLLGDAHPGQAEEIVIAEGYSTAATIHEMTGLSVAVAFTASNLEPVAQSVRDQYPDATIYVAGDNDHAKEREIGPDGKPKKNVGKKAAIDAAEAVSGTAVIPPFSEDDRGSDWNDFLQIKGKNAWKQQWKSQILSQSLSKNKGSIGHMKRKDIYAIQVERGEITAEEAEYWRAEDRKTERQARKHPADDANLFEEAVRVFSIKRRR